MPPIAILGPTASGKSALAVEVARHVGGTVVNGDPFQALQGLAIGTGQPAWEEQRGVPHVGYGQLPLSTRLSPASLGPLVRQWLGDVAYPVLVTGSGLYLKGIWDQLDQLPEVPEVTVGKVRDWSARLRTPVLHRYLAVVDDVRAAALHPNDTARIQRALALHLATGLRPSDLLSGFKRGLPSGWKALLVLPKRGRQMERIQLRVRSMITQGWAEEVRRVRAEGYEEDLRRIRPLGYLAWLDGEDPEVIEAQIVRETQAYAKRQGTWFRNQLPEIGLWDPDSEPVAAALERLAL